MTKLLEILKRKLCVTKFTAKGEQVYMLDACSNQLTEDEYNLIKEFIEKEDEEDGK